MRQPREPRAFHVRREPRERYAVDQPLIGTRGDLVIADTAGIRRLAARMNILREPGAPSIQAGEIGALGLLHEVGHLLIARYEAERRPGAIRAALADLEDRLGPDAVRLLDRFGEEFPGQGDEPETPAHRLEELLLTRVSNENPAVGSIRELIDDRALVAGTRYRDAIARLESTFSDGPPVDGEGTSLLELMRMPARRAPTSLAGQLRFIRANWGDILGDALDEVIHRLDLAVGILAEEERALHLRFGGGGGGGGGGGARRRRRWAAGRDAVVRRRRRGARGVLLGLGLDAARRADGQEHVRLARPAVARATGARSTRSTRSPTRSSTRSPAGASPGCG